MIPMLKETDAISCLLNERNAALNRIEILETQCKGDCCPLASKLNAADDRVEELEAADLTACIKEMEAAKRITELEAENSAIVEDAALVMDENERLRRIAEAAVRYLEYHNYTGLINALRAEGYLGGGE